MRTIILVLALLAGAPASGQSLRGDPVVGEQLARRQCAECHQMSGARTAIAGGIPTFRAIADDARLTELALRAFLQTPHDRMPNIVLDRREIDNLIAYIDSLKTP